MSAVPASSAVLAQLRRRLLATQSAPLIRSVVSTGFCSIDALLPHAGLPSGSVIEWISDSPGIRTSSVAIRCAAGFMERPGAVAVLDSNRDFFAGCATASGIPLQRLLVIRLSDLRDTRNDAAVPGTVQAGRTSQTSSVSSDTRDGRNEIAGYRNSHQMLRHRQRVSSNGGAVLWTLEQLARNSGVCLVISSIDHLTATSLRRLQLAVESSGATILLIRSSTALKQNSWADFRFHVQSVGQDEEKTIVAVRLIRTKNGILPSNQVLLKINHETGAVSEAAELVRPASATNVVDLRGL